RLSDCSIGWNKSQRDDDCAVYCESRSSGFGIDPSIIDDCKQPADSKTGDAAVERDNNYAKDAHEYPAEHAPHVSAKVRSIGAIAQIGEPIVPRIAINHNLFHARSNL